MGHQGAGSRVETGRFQAVDEVAQPHRCGWVPHGGHKRAAETYGQHGARNGDDERDGPDA